MIGQKLRLLLTRTQVSLHGKYEKGHGKDPYKLVASKHDPAGCLGSHDSSKLCEGTRW